MLRRLRLALVTDEFRQKIQRLVHTLVYRTPGFKGGKKYLPLYAVRDPQDAGDPGYYYVERLGRDSVAFVLVDSSGEQGGDNTLTWGVLEQFHSPLRCFVRGAFTGSLDKDELDLVGTVIEEVIEEAGYRVTPDRVLKVTSQPVSANCNETVHIYVVDVNGIPQDKAEPENIFEANTNIHWVDLDSIFAGCEWKAQLAVLHWLALKDV